MYSFQHEKHIRKPIIHATRPAEPPGPRVAMMISGNIYHLEIREAYALANRLVDVAEELENRAA